MRINYKKLKIYTQMQLKNFCFHDSLINIRNKKVLVDFLYIKDDLKRYFMQAISKIIKNIS